MISLTSFQFVVFAFAAVIIYYISPLKFRNISIFALSFAFYAMYSVPMAFFLFIFSAAVYLFAFAVQKIKNKYLLLFLCFIILIPLAASKYAAELINCLGDEIFKGAAVPLGISYFTFKSIGYIADVYRGKCPAEKNFINFAAFNAFFPEIFLGPIDRADNLLMQINNGEKRFNVRSIESGFFKFIGGFFIKLVVADRMGVIVNTVYTDLYLYEGFTVLTAVCLYSLQLYFDFCGSCYIACGTAEMLGYNIPENFRQPYLACSIKEFWSRWHISLTSWFKDYVYIPLGGNRKGKARQYLNIMTVYLLSGIWHGYGLTFIVWGLLNGIYQVLESTFGTVLKKICGFGEKTIFPVNIWLKRLYVFILSSAAWVFFRAENMQQAFLVFEKMFSRWNPWVLFDGSLFELGLSKNNVIILILAAAAAVAADIIREKGVTISNCLQNRGYIVKSAAAYIIIFVILIFGMYGGQAQASIYINF